MFPEIDGNKSSLFAIEPFEILNLKGLFMFDFLVKK